MIYRFYVMEPIQGETVSFLERECTSDVDALSFAADHYQKWWEKFNIYIVKQLTEDSCGPVSTIAKLIHQF